MATITLTIPDADLPDLTAALSQDWQLMVPDPAYQLTVKNAQGADVPNPAPQALVPNPIPRGAWAKQNLGRQLAGLIAAYRLQQHAQAFAVPATVIVAQ